MTWINISLMKTMRIGKKINMKNFFTKISSTHFRKRLFVMIGVLSFTLFGLEAITIFIMYISKYIFSGVAVTLPPIFPETIRNGLLWFTGLGGASYLAARALPGSNEYNKPPVNKSKITKPKTPKIGIPNFGDNR